MEGGVVVPDHSRNIFEVAMPKRDQNRLGEVEVKSRHFGKFSEVVNNGGKVGDVGKGDTNIVGKSTKHIEGVGGLEVTE